MYTLPKLKYADNALEPYYDEATVKLHQYKHHQTYIDNLNNLLQQAPIAFQQMDLNTLLVNLHQLPTNLATGIRNNAGGHYAHTLFFDQFTNPQNPISGEILNKINSDFGSFDIFIEKFNNLAKTNFGSGWTWLVLNENKQLEVINTSGHNTPLELNKYPLLVIDIWEHAYYLKFQNRRTEWIDNFWKIIDWDFVNQRLLTILNK